MTCERCGQIEDSKALEKYVARTGKVLCESCRAPRRNRLSYGAEVCLPHHGAFDDDDNPVNEFGVELMPGVRSCNHRDCVNPAHVEGAVVVERKRGRPAKPIDEDEAIVRRIRNRG